MDYTREHLAAVRESLLSGERVVQYNGRRIEYRSLDELRQIEAMIIAALQPRRPRHRAIFDKGL